MTHGEAFGKLIIAHRRPACRDGGADHLATIPRLKEHQVVLNGVDYTDQHQGRNGRPITNQSGPLPLT
jgi:hypothetical protein